MQQKDAIQRRSTMGQPIFKVWFMKYKESWYKLTTEEQNKLMAQNAESMKQVGGEIVMVNTCSWSSEEWLAWGVEKYPNVEAAQQHALNLFNMNWYQYIEGKTYLGVEMPQG
jgi:hypothetical protein